MRQNYATALTKDYLEYLGITEVSEDGTKIMKGDKELTQNNDGRYKLITLYDPAIRKATPEKLRTNTTGQLHIGVHRVVYCWFNKIIPTGMVIDHINSDKLDNRLENLQLLTPKENLSKERIESTRELKCKLDQPRSYFEDKLKTYAALYANAKLEHNAKEAHKQRSNIAQTRAKLRYYDNHKEEANQMTEFKKDLLELAYWKKVFKDEGNKRLWHECCTIEKMVKTKGTDAWVAVKHALEVIHEHFGR
jgi:hypothetical protein